MAQLTASAITSLYVCPSGKVATKSARFCQTGTGSATLRLYKTAAASPAQGDELIYGRAIAAGAEIEVTGIYCNAGDKIFAWVSDTLVSVNVYGPEENV